MQQYTLSKQVSVTGIGLHTGKISTMTFCPAAENYGYVFQRMDLEGMPVVAALAENVVDTARGTTIESNGAKVYTVEHVLAALVGLGIDNMHIEIDGPEPPIMDGSAKAFMEVLGNVKLLEQEAKRNYIEIAEKIAYHEPERGVHLVIEPDDHFSLHVEVDYNSPVLLPQEATLDDINDFGKEIAPCRTFCFLREIEMMFKAGLIQGGSLDNAIVIADRVVSEEELENLAKLLQRPAIKVQKGILNTLNLQFENEPARHKLLDLIGDLALTGGFLKAKVTAIRPGHKANTALAKKVRELNPVRV